jgi:ATP-dependent RNA helicase DDX54/DBP10
MDNLYRNEKKKKQKVSRDDEFYIPYAAPDKHTEEG